jgi:hypothetical protein
LEKGWDEANLFILVPMKPKHNLLFKLFICLLTAAALPGCSSEIGTWKNEQIKESTREELHKLSDQLFNYIKDNDTKNLESILSKEMLEDNTAATIAQRISHELRVDSFVRFNEYYVVNKYTQTDTVKALDEGVNSHRLIYPGTAQEMYILLLTPQNKAIANKSMITAVFSHLDYGWKLTKLDLALYTINGKTSPELFKLAKEEYGKGHLVSAVNFAELATTCAWPNEIWQYKTESELYKFNGKAIKEANDKYLFPFPISKISTEPLIIGIFNNTSDEGTFPVVSYQTKIKLKNIEALKKEQAEIKKAIAVLMPGIDKNRKYLIYAAYNEMPSATKNVVHYDIKEKLE